MLDIGPLELLVLLVAVGFLVVLAVVLSRGGARVSGGGPDAAAAAPAPTPQTSAPAAGWYPDAEVPDGQRWWDGTAWTEGRLPPSA